MKTSPGWLWQASRPPHQVGSDSLRDHYKSTKPERLHWICVGNTNLLGLCTPVKIPKGSDARKMPYFVRKYISHTAAGLAELEPHVKNKAKWHAIRASLPDDRIHELSSLGAFLGQTESAEPKPAWRLCLIVYHGCFPQSRYLRGGWDSFLVRISRFIPISKRKYKSKELGAFRSPM